MADNKLDKFKKLVSKEKSGWLEKAKWRKENEEWLDISFKIAVKVMSALKANKETGTFPKNQKELADALDCTPQYVSKLLKGKERLGIDTITKVGKIIGVKLIEVPKEETFPDEVVSNENALTVTVKIEEMMMFKYHFSKLLKDNNKYCFDYNEMVEESTYIRPNTNHLKVA